VRVGKWQRSSFLVMMVMVRERLTAVFKSSSARAGLGLGLGSIQEAETVAYTHTVEIRVVRTPFCWISTTACAMALLHPQPLGRKREGGARGWGGEAKEKAKERAKEGGHGGTR
jgi:hypothetical protein